MAENSINTDEDVFCSDDEEDLEEVDDSLLYFGGLLRRGEPERALWMCNFEKALKTWSARSSGERTASRLLSAHLPRALCLSRNCPFKDVREKLSRFLDELEASGHTIPKAVYKGPSSFIPDKVCVCYENTDDALLQQLSVVQPLYEETFMQEGRLPHLVQLLGYHPLYLDCFSRTHDFLMRGNGPLPLHIRNYLAILAASRHKCSYLVMLQEGEFIKNGGDVSWLQGIQCLPSRMLSLLAINKLLAHQPWQVSQAHMKDLLRGLDSWSVSELVHALVIMAHFHALASFSLGCGINPEIDSEMGHTLGEISENGEIGAPFPPYYSNPALGMGGTPSDSDLDSETMSPVRSPTQNQVSRSLVEHFIENSSSSTEAAWEKTLTETLKEKLKVMKEENSSDEEEPEQNNIQFRSAASEFAVQASTVPVPTPLNLVKYIEDPSFEHEDFTNSSVGTLRARDYSWEDHGFSFINGLYPDIGPLLDEKFKLAFQLTYRMMGGERDVDTRHFREAVWYYIHSIKGIRHDDYHYRKVNQILDIHLKGFIRNVGCFPEKITKWDFTNNMTGFEFSEKVHVNILVLEARMQAELIYALRAIMTYMKNL